MPPKQPKRDDQHSVILVEDEEFEATTSNSKRVHTSDLDRERICKAYLAGKSVRDIAEILDLNKRRVEMIIRKYTKTGKVRSDHVTPVATSKLTPEQAEMVRLWASEDATISGNQMAQRIQEAFNVTLSIPAVYRYIGSFVFSFKRFGPVESEIVNDSRTIGLRREYAQIFSDLPSTYAADTELVFVGQMRFRLSIRDRESKGKLRMRNMSVCVALNRSGPVSFHAQSTPISQAEFRDFLFALIDELKLNAGIASGILIMDEGDLKDDIDTISSLVMDREYTNIFLPPNSSFLNPIETLFGEFREMIDRANPTTETELIKVIEEGKKLITSQDCERYWHGMNNYVARCLNSEAIETPPDTNALYSNLSSMFVDEPDDKQHTIVIQHY